jgi:hypothetical protein
MRPSSPLPLALLLALGCNGKTETGIKTKALAPAETTAVGFPRADAPAASDPTAKAAVAKILVAHSNNDLSVYAKMKGVVFGREGKHVSVDSPLAGLPVKFTLSATWPGRGRYVWITGTAPPMTYRLLDKQAFQDVPNGQLMPPLSERQFADLYSHLYSDWLQLLVPLAEPDAVVAPGPDFALDGKTYPGVRLWNAGQPQAIVYYDPATSRVVRIAYDGKENGLPTYVELALSDHKMTNGVLLAHKVYVRLNGRDFMDFDKATLEFPKEHAAKVFSEP